MLVCRCKIHGFRLLVACVYCLSHQFFFVDFDSEKKKIVSRVMYK